MMRVVLVAMVVCFSAVSAFASHLGQIVFGQERLEGVVYCFELRHAMTIAKEEEKSIAAGESVEQYIRKVAHLMSHSEICGVAVVRYVPLETIYQWNGRFVDEKGEIKLVLASLVKVVSGGKEFYVLTSDEAPAPALQKKK